MAAAAVSASLQFAAGGLDRGGQGVDHLVAQVGGLAGGGAAQLEQRGVPGRPGCLGGGFGLPDPGGRGFPGRVGHHPVRVIGGGGVGVEGVQGEPGAGVAEVVLLPPPRAQPPAHLPGGQVVREVSAWICRVAPAFAGTRRVTCRSVTVWPLRGPSLMPSSHGRVGELVLVGPAPVIGAGDGGERLGGQVGGRALAPGEQAEPGGGDVGEQRRGPAAPVKAHRHPPPLAHDLPQRGEQAAQLAGQGVRRLGDDHEHRVAVLTR